MRGLYFGFCGLCVCARARALIHPSVHPLSHLAILYVKAVPVSQFTQQLQF